MTPGIDPVQALEHMGPVLCRDPWSVVTHLHENATGELCAGERDGCVGGSVVKGIASHCHDCLENQVNIGHY